MVAVQNILLIPLSDKSRVLKYRRRWWSPFIGKQLGFALEYRCRWWSFFPDKQLALGNRQKVSGGIHFKQIFSVVKTCQNCTLEKIVIEGVSYLIKQFGTCTFTHQLCIVDRSGCSCCSDLPMGRKVMQYQILPLKSKNRGWKNRK